MSRLAIIGGTGLTALEGLEIIDTEVVDTPYGAPSAPLLYGRLDGCEVIFLARHGNPHTIPPHRVNYRANLWALRSAGATRVLGVAAVGGIRRDMGPGVVIVPDQIIDYTYGRAHTLFDEELNEVTHIDFTEPYCSELRGQIIEACRLADVDVVTDGTYGATQGPRLESSAEIDRMERDGSDLVGMTGMPEASLARELGLCYASCAVVANWAAGRSDGPITMEQIEHNLGSGMERVRAVIRQLLAL